MPGRDRSGPVGKGPTGWGQGPCREEDPNFINRGNFGGFGRGMSRRGGGRRGGFFRPWAAVAPQDEKTQLKEQRNWLKSQMEQIDSRLKDLESE